MHTDSKNKILYKIKMKNKKREITKNIIKKLRLTDAEWSAIEKKLKETGMTFSKFALSSMLSRRIRLPIERELLTELSKQGNNLNQIAAKLNSGESLDRVGLRIIAENNSILRRIYKRLGK
nr:plasmid mobilization relaxosome protein MobC [uncultured Campylobacter sp.]